MANIDAFSLCCPTTRAPLRREGGVLSGGGVSYPIIDGVPDFLGEADISFDDHDAGIHTDYEISRKKAPGLGKRAASLCVERFEREAFEAARARVGRRLDMLDVGAGSSKFIKGADGARTPMLELFAEHARSYAGVEPSWSMIKQVLGPKSALDTLDNAMIARAVGEGLPFADGSFDLVIVKSTLDHCADAARALAECRRVLRPHGTLLITLQNFLSWPRRLMSVVMAERYARHRARDHHTSPFDPALLRGALGDAGLRVQRLEEIGYLSVSRYRLAWLENAVYGLPYRVGGPEGLVRAARATDRALHRVLPEFGTAMMCVAEPESRASTGLGTSAEPATASAS